MGDVDALPRVALRRERVQHLRQVEDVDVVVDHDDLGHEGAPRRQRFQRLLGHGGAPALDGDDGEVHRALGRHIDGGHGDAVLLEPPANRDGAGDRRHDRARVFESGRVHCEDRAPSVGDRRDPGTDRVAHLPGAIARIFAVRAFLGDPVR
jgi:hypothetical protein